MKEMAKYGADLKELVPKEILKDVIERSQAQKNKK